MYVCRRCREGVIAVRVCDFVVALILFSAVFLAGSPLPLVARAMSFEERRLANDSLGLAIGALH